MTRLIRPKIAGRTLSGPKIAWARTLGGSTAAKFKRAVEGTQVARVWRRAKWIVVDLERAGASAGHLLIHLRMTGRLVVAAEAVPYDRVSIQLDGGPERLVFSDVRKFGRFQFMADPGPVLDALGPEPLCDEFTADWLYSALRSRKRALKPLLLDQTFLAGLGNIYVDEALHRSRLHPQRGSNQVDKRAAGRLHDAIREVLEGAIKLEGSSFDTFYRTPEGQPGAYQHQFLVYGRDGQRCHSCSSTIVKMVVGQRGTHICRRCQPKPRRQSGLPTAT